MTGNVGHQARTYFFIMIVLHSFFNDCFAVFYTIFFAKLSYKVIVDNSVVKANSLVPVQLDQIYTELNFFEYKNGTQVYVIKVKFSLLIVAPLVIYKASRKCQLDACVAVPAFDFFFAIVEIKELPLQINWLNKDICFTYDSLFLLMKQPRFKT